MPDAPNKELIGAATSLLVLGVLAKGPSYGYDIVRQLNESAGDLFEWQEGTIYPILHKLEKDQQLRAQWQDADTGRRRKYYYITAKGRAVLSREAKQFASFHLLIRNLIAT